MEKPSITAKIEWGICTMKEPKRIFTPDCPTVKPLMDLQGMEIADFAVKIDAADASRRMIEKGDAFAREIAERFVADFEDAQTDQMVHVTTFAVIDGMIYMTYYANVQSEAEDPKYQQARLAYCPVEDPANKTILIIQQVDDECGGLPVVMVYDTIFARVDADTLYILWTAKVGDNYYRLYRPFSLSAKELGEVGVNRLKIGQTVNDFSATGIRNGLSENGIGCKRMYSDIGIMQKFTARMEDGVLYYYTGAYSGDLNMIIKSSDFITWEYVSQPSFGNLSMWENATYVIGDKCYYFVRQQMGSRYGFLTVYHLNEDVWEKPVLVEDCQSRSDFFEYQGNLYMVFAPIDREHIGILKVDTDNIAGSEVVLQADMQGSCFYPFINYFTEEELAMSYTVSRKHVRLARFDLSKYLD